MSLSSASEKFILHWGEMGARWGVNRSVAQIHALLFLEARALTAEDISNALDIARSNVSNSLHELLSWNLVKMVHIMGDRRDYYETSTDVWALMRTIVRERHLRELEPTRAVLRELLAGPEAANEPGERVQRLQQLKTLLDALAVWSDQMLRLDADTLSRVLRLGARVQKFLHGHAEPIDDKAAPGFSVQVNPASPTTPGLADLPLPPTST